MRPPQAFLAIRIGMMTGVLLFGAVTWFLHQRPEWTPATNLVGQFTTVGRIMWGIAGAGLAGLFIMQRKADSPVKASSLALIGWTVGEALCLFGAVCYYLTGISTWYIAGLIAMAITFVAFRPPAPR